jgi:hypothetical protein
VRSSGVKVDGYILHTRDAPFHQRAASFSGDQYDARYSLLTRPECCSHELGNTVECLAVLDLHMGCGVIGEP